METIDTRQQLCAAITHCSLVMFQYGDLIRVGEPHRFGVNSAGNEMMSGGSAPGTADPTPWAAGATFCSPK